MLCHLVKMGSMKVIMARLLCRAICRHESITSCAWKLKKGERHGRQRKRRSNHERCNNKFPFGTMSNPHNCTSTQCTQYFLSHPDFVERYNTPSGWPNFTAFYFLRPNFFCVWINLSFKSPARHYHRHSRHDITISPLRSVIFYPLSTVESWKWTKGEN